MIPEGLIAEPERPPAPVDWDAVARRVGTPLPADYRAFVDRWGHVKLDGHVIVEAPAPGDESGLVGFVRWKLATDRDHREDGLIDGALWPERDGLLPWGWTEEGTTLFWRTGGEPDAWGVTTRRDDEEASDHGETTHYRGVTATAFLADLLGRSPSPRPLTAESLVDGRADWIPLHTDADEADLGVIREDDRWWVILNLGGVLGEPHDIAIEAFLADLAARHPRLREKVAEVRPRHSREQLAVDGGRILGRRSAERIRDAALDYACRQLKQRR